MSAVPGSPEDELYCTPDDVSVFFDKFSGPDGQPVFSDGFGTDTNPTEQEVIFLIEEQTEYIEQYTGGAWRAKRVEDELKNLELSYYFNAGTPFQLMHRNVRDLDPDKGDKLEVFEGSIGQGSEGYNDFLTDPEETQGRNDGDFWIDSTTGKLYIYKAGYFFDRYKYLRVTYRYGKDKVPASIRNACAKLVAADLLRTQQYRVVTPGSEGSPDELQTADAYQEQALRRLDKYKEIKSIGVNS
jgi:hypothetical protein